MRRRPGNELDRAEPLYARSLGILENRLGQDHPNIATSLLSSGRLHLARGDLQRAEADLVRSIEIRQSAFGEESPLLVAPLRAQAEVLRELGREEEASAAERRAERLDDASRESPGDR